MLVLEVFNESDHGFFACRDPSIQACHSSWYVFNICHGSNAIFLEERWVNTGIQGGKRLSAFHQAALAFGRGLEVECFCAVESFMHFDCCWRSRDLVWGCGSLKNFSLLSRKERVRDFQVARAFSPITLVVIEDVTKAVMVDFAILIPPGFTFFVDAWWGAVLQLRVVQTDAPCPIKWCALSN
jgi:hypothetical protein